MNKHAKKPMRGFTLVEILVVVAIIGILTAVLYANFSDAKAVSRDRQRMIDLKQLQLAIRLYQEDTNNLPVPGCGRGSSAGPWASEGTGNGGVCADYISGLSPQYIPALPNDPILKTIGSDTFGYSYRRSGATDTGGFTNGWKVVVFGDSEKMAITSYDDEFARCPAECSGGGNPFCEITHSAFANSYAVYNDAGKCL